MHARCKVFGRYTLFVEDALPATQASSQGEGAGGAPTFEGIKVSLLCLKVVSYVN